MRQEIRFALLALVVGLSAGCDNGVQVNIPPSPPSLRVGSITPAPGAALAAAPAQIIIDFTMSVDINTVNISSGSLAPPTILIQRANGDGVVNAGDPIVTPASFGLTDASGIASSRLTLSMAGVQMPNDLYRVTIVGTGATPLKNTKGEAFDGDADGMEGGDYTATFTINEPLPKVTAVFPLQDARLQAAPANIRINFTKPIDPATVTFSNFILLRSKEGLVNGKFDDGNDERIVAGASALTLTGPAEVTFSLSGVSSLPEDKYRIIVKAPDPLLPSAVNYVKDTSGNGLDGEYWTHATLVGGTVAGTFAGGTLSLRVDGGPQQDVLLSAGGNVNSIVAQIKVKGLTAEAVDTNRDGTVDGLRLRSNLIGGTSVLDIIDTGAVSLTDLGLPAGNTHVVGNAGALPSGNGVLGGDFISEFTIKLPAPPLPTVVSIDPLPAGAIPSRPVKITAGFNREMGPATIWNDNFVLFRSAPDPATGLLTGGKFFMNGSGIPATQITGGVTVIASGNQAELSLVGQPAVVQGFGFDLTAVQTRAGAGGLFQFQADGGATQTFNLTPANTADLPTLAAAINSGTLGVTADAILMRDAATGATFNELRLRSNTVPHSRIYLRTDTALTQGLGLKYGVVDPDPPGSAATVLCSRLKGLSMKLGAAGEDKMEIIFGEEASLADVVNRINADSLAFVPKDPINRTLLVASAAGGQLQIATLTAGPQVGLVIYGGTALPVLGITAGVYMGSGPPALPGTTTGAGFNLMSVPAGGNLAFQINDDPAIYTAVFAGGENPGQVAAKFNAAYPGLAVSNGATVRLTVPAIAGSTVNLLSTDPATLAALGLTAAVGLHSGVPGVPLGELPPATYRAILRGNGCLGFDGESEFVEIASNYIIDPSDKEKPFTLDEPALNLKKGTVEVWIRLRNDFHSGLGRTMSIFSKELNQYPQQELGRDDMSIKLLPDGRLSFHFDTNGGPGSIDDIYSNQDFWEKDRWYHVACVWDQTDGVNLQELYIDGVLQADLRTNFTGELYGNSPIYVGCFRSGEDNRGWPFGYGYFRTDQRGTLLDFPGSPQNNPGWVPTSKELNLDGFFEGYVDELRIWDHVRTNAEILQWMNIGLVDRQIPINGALVNPLQAAITNGLIGYWNFNDGNPRRLEEDQNVSHYVPNPTAREKVLGLNGTLGTNVWVFASTNTQPFSFPSADFTWGTLKVGDANNTKGLDRWVDFGAPVTGFDIQDTNGLILDGEFFGTFPSGDGNQGGFYRSDFTILP
jgi:hypothetical protein